MDRVNKLKERYKALKPYVTMEAISKLSGVNKKTLSNAISCGYSISTEKIQAVESALYVLEEIFN